MNGPECPRCGGETELLSTTNKWCYYCPECDIRFNLQREILESLPKGKEKVCER